MHLLILIILAFISYNYIIDNSMHKFLLVNIVNRRIKYYRQNDIVSSVSYTVPISDIPKLPRRRIIHDIEDMYFPDKFIKRIITKINTEVWFDDNGKVKGVYLKLDRVNEDNMTMTFTVSIRNVSFRH